jgi:hypothetical protein
MYNFKNPHGATPALIKEQELEDNLIKAEFAWNDAKTLDEKKKALELVNSALGEIEKFHNEKVAKKPNLYFDVDPSLIPTMMQEMEARIIKHERLQNWQNPEWMDEQLDELSNLKEMGYSESEASKYVGILGNSVREVREILDLDNRHAANVEWDNQSWEEQRG